MRQRGQQRWKQWNKTQKIGWPRKRSLAAAGGEKSERANKHSSNQSWVIESSIFDVIQWVKLTQFSIYLLLPVDLIFNYSNELNLIHVDILLFSRGYQIPISLISWRNCDCSPDNLKLRDDTRLARGDVRCKKFLHSHHGGEQVNSCNIRTWVILAW